MKDNFKYSIGILAYGSLISDPGEEINNLTIARINVITPFNVEFKRSSSTRSYAPTLIPVTNGGRPVKGVILVLNEQTTIDAAKTILWRRERHSNDYNEVYSEPSNPTPNKVRVRSLNKFCEVEIVLYTEIGQNISEPVTASLLSDLAIRSILSDSGSRKLDGVRYLLNAKKSGIITELSEDYEKEILNKTNARSLEEVIEKLDKQRTVD